jgi:hypothetical protein
MKRKYREAMRAAARQQAEPDDDDDAPEVRDWFEEWAMQAAPEQQEMNNQRSNE